MKILHLDSNHPLMIEELTKLGFDNTEDFSSTKAEVEAYVHEYDGLIIRSRFTIDKAFLDKATHLKFIGRVGAGLENIDVEYAKQKGIKLYNAPEGNRNAVSEHALGMLLSLFNKLRTAHDEVANGQWRREANRGYEVEGKSIGLIGYGNTGKAMARKLSGFDCEVLCYDILENVGDKNAKQVSLAELKSKADVISLHTPQTPETLGMINHEFIDSVAKPFWLINTARGKSVVTADLVHGLQSGKILGAGLDVLEYEKSSFEDMFSRAQQLPEAFQYLMEATNVLLSPHVAGWTFESHIKLAQTIVDKIHIDFKMS
ncbi:2-hydroxyacid dehydrogenase [Psychroflexus sp. CAK57W]|uniref:2-hydroxyacid dehydrogenase n=1 Tax=Psychroflexus curvus TaxID=2873595 RepID=UPI001CCE5A5C|nr:2-hydroxyacid dehydrogenase [Psychroflexus curvus]MBZ9628278.1 2-hydroxyacid dehydrogenase [Psychroflexus curvus]MBZ9788315.1 2-hydroxyacid dehydrogenase [Psychroflexus curvus]